MPATPSPINDVRFGPHWTAVLGAMQSMQAQIDALTSGSQNTLIPDADGNGQLIIGQLNQTVTIGSTAATGGSLGSGGVHVGTGLGIPGSGEPSTGLAFQQGLVTGTISVTAGSATATLLTSSGTFAPGMVIGAADVSDPASGTPTPAIVPAPATTILGVSGSTLTLSQKAAESGVGLYCAACYWRLISAMNWP